MVDSGDAFVGSQSFEETVDDTMRSWRHLEVSIVRLGAGCLMSARDVTEHRVTKRALRDLNQVMRTLTEADTVLVSATDQAEFLASMCQVIVRTGGYTRAWVAAPATDKPHGFVPIAARSEDAEFLRAVMAAPPSEVLGPVEDVVRNGKVRFVQEIKELSDRVATAQVLLDFGCRSMIVLPLSINHAAFGALVLYSDVPNSFPPEEAQLLERLAADMSYGVSALRAKLERKRYLEQLEHGLSELVRAIASVVEFRDPYTAGHQRRVGQLAAAISRELGGDPQEVMSIEMAGSIHDIGKVSVPAEILSKPGALTAPEFEMIKPHSEIGYQIVRGIEFPGPVDTMILQHHERLDGSGYPHGLVGSAIIQGARILAVADTVEAMSSHRPYRPSLGLEAALRQIDDQRDVLFDPDIVDACMAVFARGFSYDPASVAMEV